VRSKGNIGFQVTAAGEREDRSGFPFCQCHSHRVCRLEDVEAAANISNLVVLHVSINPLLQLPVALGRSQSKLAAVHASQCRLNCVPPGLAHARGLRTLQLSGNRLHEFEAHVLEGVHLCIFDRVA
jgi:hypothetical protein